MNRTFHIHNGGADRMSHAFLQREQLPYSRSVEDVKKALSYLKDITHINKITPELLLVAISIRQPELTRDLFGEGLQEKLIGKRVYDLGELTYSYPPIHNNELDDKTKQIFTLAKARATTLGRHSKFGCGELLIAILECSERSPTIKALVDELDIDVESVKLRFVQANRQIKVPSSTTDSRLENLIRPS